MQMNEQNLEGRLDWWKRQGIQGRVVTCPAKGQNPATTVKYWENSRRSKTKWPMTRFAPPYISEHSQSRSKISYTSPFPFLQQCIRNKVAALHTHLFMSTGSHISETNPHLGISSIILSSPWKNKIKQDTDLTSLCEWKCHTHHSQKMISFSAIYQCWLLSPDSRLQQKQVLPHKEDDSRACACPVLLTCAIIKMRSGDYEKLHKN